MQDSNLISIAAIAMGVLFAVCGCRRGFYIIWTLLFNIMISIYLSVMLTPTVAGFLPMLFGTGTTQTQGTFWYIYAAVAAGVAVAAFLILQIVAMTYFTGTFNVSLPKIVDNLGAAFVGFIAGYVLWGFICFLILIMPVSGSVILKSFTSGTQSKDLSMPAVSKVVNTINFFSLQPNRPQVRNVIRWTLDIPEPNESR